MPRTKSSSSHVGDIAAFRAKYAGQLIDPEEVARNYGFLRSRSLKITSLLGGGYPLGTISELYGPAGAGKTAEAIGVAGMVQKDVEAGRVEASGGNIAWMDLEWALDLSKDSPWLKVNGLDPLHPTFHLLQPQDGEEMYEMLEEILLGGFFRLGVVDSVGAITTRAEMDGAMGESHFGQVARLNSVALKRLMARFRTNPSKTHLLFINQIRDKVNSRHGGVKSTGGNALYHLVRTKLKLWQVRGPETASSGEITKLTQVTVEKCKHAAQGDSTTIEISNFRGIDVTAEILEFGRQAGYFHKAGSYTYLYNQPVDWPTLKREETHKDPAHGFLDCIQGDSAVKEFLEKEGWVDALYEDALAVKFK